MKTSFYVMGQSGVMEPAESALLQINQVIFLNGYGQSEHNHDRLAVYEKYHTERGDLMYKLVNLDKPKLMIREANNIRPISKLFGIGLYYKPNVFASPSEVQKAITFALLNQAQEEKQRRDKNAEVERLYETGKQWLKDNVPADAKAMIIAAFEENDSDLMTDYHGSRTTKKVILGFSKSARNDFNEMRKFAAQHEVLKHLTDSKFERRENYTGGGGYYLAEHRYSGWQIYKVVFVTKYRSEIDRSECIIAGNPENIWIKAAEPKTETPVTLVDAKVTLVPYSEKSFAIIGETKPIKDQLRELGGRFNARLTCGAGWIFSNKSLEAVKKALSL